MKKQFFSLMLAIGLLLGIHNGQIGIWKNKDPEPMRTIPCPIWALSAKQRQMLQSGICIDSMEDLENLMTEFFP